MQQLHLVGFTTDLDGLIFSTRRGAKSGSYLVPIDVRLLETLGEARRLRADAGLDDGDDEAWAEVEPERPRRGARLESTLSPREIQTRLRAGRTVEEVAAEAGVDAAWVDRFASPIIAEQARVVGQARRLVYAKPRLGPSSQPLGEAVVWNLAEKGALAPLDVLDASWAARHVHGSTWVVTFRYLSRGRQHEASWQLDVHTGDLIALDRNASALGYVAPGTRRPALARRAGLIAGEVDASGASGPTARSRPARRAASTTAKRAGAAGRRASGKGTGSKATGGKATGGRTVAPVPALPSAPRGAKTGGAGRATVSRLTVAPAPAPAPASARRQAGTPAKTTAAGRATRGRPATGGAGRGGGASSSRASGRPPTAAPAGSLGPRVLAVPARPPLGGGRGSPAPEALPVRAAGTMAERPVPGGRSAPPSAATSDRPVAVFDWQAAADQRRARRAAESAGRPSSSRPGGREGAPAMPPPSTGGRARGERPAARGDVGPTGAGRDAPADAGSGPIRIETRRARPADRAAPPGERAGPRAAALGGGPSGPQGASRGGRIGPRPGQVVAGADVASDVASAGARGPSAPARRPVDGREATTQRDVRGATDDGRSVVSIPAPRPRSQRAAQDLAAARPERTVPPGPSGSDRRSDPRRAAVTDGDAPRRAASGGGPRRRPLVAPSRRPAADEPAAGAGGGATGAGAPSRGLVIREAARAASAVGADGSAPSGDGEAPLRFPRPSSSSRGAPAPPPRRERPLRAR